jgi:multimeric flavodoxin WrbA
MPEFDAIVLATPIFWFGPSAQLKLILDRTFALAKFDPKTGEPMPNPASKTKMMALIATAGGGLDGGLQLLDDSLRTAAEFTHVHYESLLVPMAPENPKDLAKKADVRQQAMDFGKRVVQG